MSGRRARVVVMAAWIAAGLPVAAEGAIPSALLRVEPLEATVGERITATLTIVLPTDVQLEPPTLGPYLGPFTVNEGAWKPAERRDDGGTARIVWTWTGSLSAFRTGSLEIPAVTVRIRPADPSADGEAVLTTAPVAVRLVSVLDATGDAELADLKPPAAVPPDYTILRRAAGIVLLLALAALAVWWLHRRYADRLAAAAVPDDPFHRVPPHVWVYAELQRLLERKLPEQGRVPEFYSALATILKRYLTGRYRVELMEQTTAEVPVALHQAGAPDSAIATTAAVLARCDRVKFAQDRPDATAWKAAVEEIYRIVDHTKPLEPSAPLREGAA